MGKTNLEEIRKRIKFRRKELGLSYQDLADKTGLSKSTLQRYETGNIGNLGLDKIEILSKALMVTPPFLLGWEDNNDKKEINNDKYIPETLAAHFDGDEFSDEDLQDIESFIEFVKQRKKNN